MTTIPPYTGIVPDRTQDPVDFNKNVQTMLNYMAIIGPAINQASSEIISLADLSIYDNGKSYSTPDSVVGSDGITYRRINTTAIGDDPVGSITGNWLVLILTIEDIMDVLQPYLDNNTNHVKDPTLCPWVVGPETFLGPGRTITNTERVLEVATLNTAEAWTNLASWGAVNQVSVDATYTTIANISGAGNLINIVLPGGTTVGDIVTCKITLDTVEHVLDFTLADAGDRVVMGLVVNKGIEFSVSTGGLTLEAFSWAGAGFNGIAACCDPLVLNCILAPQRHLTEYHTLRFENSMKVEVKSSNFSIINFRNNAAAVYRLN